MKKRKNLLVLAGIVQVVLASVLLLMFFLSITFGFLSLRILDSVILLINNLFEFLGLEFNEVLKSAITIVLFLSSIIFCAFGVAFLIMGINSIKYSKLTVTDFISNVGGVIIVGIIELCISLVLIVPIIVSISNVIKIICSCLALLLFIASIINFAVIGAFKKEKLKGVSPQMPAQTVTPQTSAPAQMPISQPTMPVAPQMPQDPQTYYDPNAMAQQYYNQQQMNGGTYYDPNTGQYYQAPQYPYDTNQPPQ